MWYFTREKCDFYNNNKKKHEKQKKGSLVTPDFLLDACHK